MSSGCVLSCVGIASLGMFGQETKTLMGLETLMGLMRLNGHESPNMCLMGLMDPNGSKDLANGPIGLRWVGNPN